MLEEREIIAAIVAIAVATFFAVNRDQLAKLPHARILMISFGLLAASLGCSVIETLFWEDVFNFLQHLFAPASMVFLAIWTWLNFVRDDEVSA